MKEMKDFSDYEQMILKELVLLDDEAFEDFKINYPASNELLENIEYLRNKVMEKFPKKKLSL